MPLGFLKRNKEIFKPSLPPRLLAGIDAVSLSHLEKVSISSPSNDRFDENIRSTSPSQKHSGSLHLPSHWTQTSHPSKELSLKIPSQATQTGSPQTTPSPQTPDAGHRKCGISPPSHLQTAAQQFSSTSTENAPPTSLPSYTGNQTPNITLSSTSSSSLTTPSYPTSQPRIQRVNPRLSCRVSGRKMN